MKIEIEAKFLDLDHDGIRKKLKDAGAHLDQPMRLMRRALIRTEDMKPPLRDAFIRVRDEGDKITLTFKQFDDLSLHGAKETEVNVTSFDDTLAILAQGGLKPQSYQETKRETWHYKDAEIVLDLWPWLNPYIEIEGPSEAIVREVASDLGLDWKDAVFGPTPEAYRAQYPDGQPEHLIDLPEVTFGAPLPKIFGGDAWPEVYTV